jgi:hypothetical protein
MGINILPWSRMLRKMLETFGISDYLFLFLTCKNDNLRYW